MHAHEKKRSKSMNFIDYKALPQMDDLSKIYNLLWIIYILIVYVAMQTA